MAGLSPRFGGLCAGLARGLAATREAQPQEATLPEVPLKFSFLLALDLSTRSLDALVRKINPMSHLSPPRGRRKLNL